MAEQGGFKAPPVPGYRDVSEAQKLMVTENKHIEEVFLRRLDVMKLDPEIDGRWLAIGRTHIEQAFMAINRAIFKPGRAKLPSDP